MKILIVSDSHGRHAGLEEAIKREWPFQLLIHLGDAEGYEEYIEEIAGCPVEIVAGNCDYFSRLPVFKELSVAGLNIFITHGHYYYAGFGYEELLKEGIRRRMDIVMYGHIHRPLIAREHAVTILNPGSISLPRQEGGQRSYIVMEAERGGDPSFEIRYVD